jgi:hypothetical protein
MILKTGENEVPGLFQSFKLSKSPDHSLEEDVPF